MAGLVDDMKALDKHPWCGHLNVIMNKTKQIWQNWGMNPLNVFSGSTRWVGNEEKNAPAFLVL